MTAFASASGSLKVADVCHGGGATVALGRRPRVADNRPSVGVKSCAMGLTHNILSAHGGTIVAMLDHGSLVKVKRLGLDDVVDEGAAILIDAASREATPAQLDNNADLVSISD